MKIKKILYKEDQLIYDVIFDYFHSYLVRFCYKNKIDYLSNDIIILEQKHLLEFKDVVYEALKQLIEECYEEPSHKQRSKYGSRYQKIFINDKQYVVNYRTDYLGILMYGLHYLLTWTEKHIKELNLD